MVIDSPTLVHGITPPRCGRLSSSSTSPDSLYKSTDSSRGLTFSSPDSDKHCRLVDKTKGKFAVPPKINFDEDSDEHEWISHYGNSSTPPRPPALRKLNRVRSRLVKSELFSPSHSIQVKPTVPLSPVTTPPHKRLRALQIHDGIHSPICSPASPTRRKLSPRASLFGSARKAIRHSPLRASTAKKPSVNPFTSPCTLQPQSLCGAPALKSSSDSGCGTDDSWPLDIPKHLSTPSPPASEEKLALREMFTSRYNEEFCEESIVGSGEFGTVFKCVNKLDGCTYAIKRSRDPVAGSTFEQVARNEVYAHAVLGKHSHVVRYYSAWAENGHLYIQNEYCNGGSLAEEISTHKKRGTRFTESELKDILKQVAHGLKYIHAQQLAHMDIKPGNIFIQYNPHIIQSPESGIEEDSSDSELNDKITYKIGDFGHVTSLNAQEVEEGDCRYLPREILTDERRYLCKADVFALGLTVYQAATLSDLPKNGDEWHKIRDGHLPEVPGYSKALNDLLKSMIQPDPRERPSAMTVSSHPELCPASLWSRKQLARQLDQERLRNELLTRQLAAVQESAELKSKCLLPDSLRQNVPRASGTRSSRLLGIKVNRSKSLTNF